MRGNTWTIKKKWMESQRGIRSQQNADSEVALSGEEEFHFSEHLMS